MNQAELSYMSMEGINILHTPEDYINIFFTNCNYSQQSIYKKCRKRELVESRQILFLYLKKNTQLTFEEIGKKVAGKDQATVRHGIKIITDLLESNDKEFIKRNNKIINLVQ